MSVLVQIHGRSGIVARSTVDEADAALAMSHRWNLDTYGYPRTSVNGVKVKLHQLLLGAVPGMVIDHIDGDPLNNCRVNLRHCTQQQNLWNRRGRHGAKIRGVHRTRTGKWAARIASGTGECLWLGTFETRAAAWSARQAAEAKHYGQFARAVG